MIVWWTLYGIPRAIVSWKSITLVLDAAAFRIAFVQKMGNEKPIIALLPGSRRQEVKSILSEMLKMAPKFPEYQFIIAGAPTLPEEFYRPFLQKYPQVNSRLFANPWNGYLH